MRGWLLLLVVALLGGAGAVWLLQFGSGYILVSFANVTVEMSIWTGLALYLVMCGLLVWLLLTLRWIASAGGLTQWWVQRKNRKHNSKTAQGLLLFFDNESARSAQVLSQSVENSSMPVINLLYAARAFADGGDVNQARQTLELLRSRYPQAGFMADKTQAELLLKNHQIEEALGLLQVLHKQKPEHGAVLRMLADGYARAEQWPVLEKFLPDLRNYRAFSKEKLADLERTVYCNLLLDFMPDPEFAELEQQQQLSESWDAVPRRLRKEPDIIAAYAEALAKVNASEELEPLLVKTLNQHWHADLLHQYGRLYSRHPEKQLLVAEKWLQSHPEDADLLLVLGQLCKRLKFWGKARDYLSTAVGLRPSAEIHVALAEVLNEIGDARGSLSVYREGLIGELKTPQVKLPAGNS